MKITRKSSGNRTSFKSLVASMELRVSLLHKRHPDFVNVFTMGVDRLVSNARNSIIDSNDDPTEY